MRNRDSVTDLLLAPRIIIDDSLASILEIVAASNGSRTNYRVTLSVQLAMITVEAAAIRCLSASTISAATANLHLARQSNELSKAEELNELSHGRSACAGRRKVTTYLLRSFRLLNILTETRFIGIVLVKRGKIQKR